jgi:diaminopimelate decarboxylase
MAAQAHCQVLKHSLKEEVISEAQPLVLFFDLIAFRQAIFELRDAFPPNFFHTLAVKANPTLRYSSLMTHYLRFFAAANSIL